MEWKYLLFSIILTIFLACSPRTQRSVKNTLTKTTIITEFQPTNGTKELRDDVSLTVRPLDAKELNVSAYLGAMQTGGNYEKVIFDWEQRLLSNENSNISKETRREIKRVKTILAYLDELVSKKKLTQEISKEIKISLLNKGGWSYDRYGFSSMNAYNPYRMSDNKYLSIFELIFKNKSNEVREFSIEDFQIINGYEQLRPLKTEYFEGIYDGEDPRLRFVYRNNLPDNFVLPPNGEIRKYIAVPPVNTTSPNLSFKYIQEKKAVNYDFTVNIKSFEENFEEFQFDTRRYSSESDNNYLLVVRNDEIKHIKGNSLLLPEEQKNIEVSLYGVVRSYSGFYYVELKDFKFSDFPRNSIRLKASYEGYKYK